MLGRAFLPEEAIPLPGSPGGAPRVAILTHEMWVRRHGSDPDIIGRQIQLNAGSATVVGVLPERFAFPPISNRGRLLPPDVGIYAPLPDAASQENGRVFVVARVAPGRSLDEVRTDLERISSRMPQADPETCPRSGRCEMAGWSVGITPLQGLRPVTSAPTCICSWASSASFS